MDITGVVLILYSTDWGLNDTGSGTAPTTEQAEPSREGRDEHRVIPLGGSKRVRAP